MGHQKPDIDLNGRREGDGNHTIGSFRSSWKDVIRRDPDGDGDYAEAPEIGILSRLDTIIRRIARSQTTKDHASAFGNGGKLASARLSGETPGGQPIRMARQM
jgi:hypothetical protein